MKHRLAPLLEGMEMGKSEHDWLEQRLENMTAKEELLFRGAMQIESPRDIQTTIQILQGLDHYQLLYGAEDDVLLGRFVMEHIHTPTHAARGYLDPEIVGAAYREHGSGSFVENHYVERLNPDRPLPEVNPNEPRLITGEYTLTDLLKQELPENESRQHTETVSLPSKNKDMESVLALLPAEKEFVTDDGLTGILSLDLSTVRVEVAGYGSSTKEVSATRSYPNLAGQDTQYIPKTIEEDGRTLTLQTVNAQQNLHSISFAAHRRKSAGHCLWRHGHTRRPAALYHYRNSRWAF